MINPNGTVSLNILNEQYAGLSYDFVTEVDATSVQDAYKRTQGYNWSTIVGNKLRSVMIGDVIKCGDDIYLVAANGMIKI